MKSLRSALFAASCLACAARAAEPLPPPPTDVVKIDHTKVDVVFKRGGSLLDSTSYKVQAGRRVAVGPAEIHTRDTDIFYIVDGSATFVTGGTAVEPKDTAPGEIRAKSITGGTERHLTKGDVIVVPNGVPHQFTQLDGAFLYFVVKVTK